MADAVGDPYIGSIRIFGFNYTPKGWAVCDGQLLSISQNTALFAIIGNRYGGDGKMTFALPDFRGCLPIHCGQVRGGPSYECGQTDVEPVRLTAAQLPPHIHFARCTDRTANTDDPSGAIWTNVSSNAMGAYAHDGMLMQMGSHASGVAGKSQPHENMMPSLVLNFCIALDGVFPPRG